MKRRLPIATAAENESALRMRPRIMASRNKRHVDAFIPCARRLEYPGRIATAILVRAAVATRRSDHGRVKHPALEFAARALVSWR